VVSAGLFDPSGHLGLDVPPEKQMRMHHDRPRRRRASTGVAAGRRVGGAKRRLTAASGGCGLHRLVERGTSRRDEADSKPRPRVRGLLPSPWPRKDEPPESRHLGGHGGVARPTAHENRPHGPDRPVGRLLQTPSRAPH